MNQSADEKRLQKARNDANNANTIYNAATIAENSGHPLAASIGKGVKVADKLTGGKSTQMLGKAMTRSNSLSGVQGKLMQAASNKLGESGLGNKISSAKNKNNSASSNNPKIPSQNNKKTPGTINNKNIDNSSSKRDVRDQASDGGDASFKVDFKILYWGLIVCAACLPVIIFCNLFMSASQIYIKSIGLGNADILGSDAVESKIDKKIDDDEDLNENPTDSETDDSTNTLGYSNFEINISDNSKKIRDNKLRESNIVQIARTSKRKYNEATLEQLEDFYPSVGSLSEKYDEDLVYDFFFKMYNIFTTYKSQHNVELDLPLLMSTLMIQSEDMNEIFDSNLTQEEKSKRRISKLRIKSLYSYDTDLSSYRLSPDNSEHDMELLAQNMVSKGENGNYKLDEEKYKEFLKEFLERKYFIEDVGSPTVDSSMDGNYVGNVEFMTGGVGKIFYYNQLDYPSSPYSSYGSIASHGCGPTSLSIAISSLLKEEHDPIELTKYVCGIGGCTNDGTGWAAIGSTPQHYGLKAIRTGDKQAIVNALAKGNSIVIAIMCPGHFTSGGHFITLTGVKDNGKVTVADPASRDRSTDWDFNIILEETCSNDGFWIVSR